MSAATTHHQLLAHVVGLGDAVVLVGVDAEAEEERVDRHAEDVEERVGDDERADTGDQ